MSENREPIAVVGTGYVGLVTAAGFAELGNDVWCVDIDQAKVDALQRGEIPIYEPGLTESIAANRDRLHFSTDLGPALEALDLFGVDVDAPDLRAELGETGSGHQAHVAGPDHRDGLRL